MILIRSMSAGDIDAVLLLERAIPEAPHWSRSAYEETMAPGDFVQRAALVAIGENALLGFAVAKVVADVCELESMAVDENARRQGIGARLLSSVFAWAQACGAGRAELEVRASNSRAIRFYEKSGFAPEGIRTSYYANPVEDALLMGRVLAGGGKLP